MPGPVIPAVIAAGGGGAGAGLSGGSLASIIGGGAGLLGGMFGGGSNADTGNNLPNVKEVLKMLRGKQAKRTIGSGLSNLEQIIAAQGQTDPRLFAQQLLGIQQGTAQQQEGLQSQLARLGLTNSGLGIGLNAAIGAGGATQEANLRAQEAALAEERKRRDLELLYNLLIGPNINIGSTRAGIGASLAPIQSQQRQSDLAALGTLLGSLGQAGVFG